jgi:hypothetical protein
LPRKLPVRPKGQTRRVLRRRAHIDRRPSRYVAPSPGWRCPMSGFSPTLSGRWS